MNRPKAHLLAWFVYAIVTLSSIEYFGHAGIRCVSGLDYSTSKRRTNTPFPFLRNPNLSRGGNVVQLRNPAKEDKNHGIEIKNATLEAGNQTTPSNYDADESMKVSKNIQRNEKSLVSIAANSIHQKLWVRLDEMDKLIVRNTLPLVGLMSIVPLVASTDLFWVNQMGDALAVSAQSAANTVFQFSFGLFSFLPSVTATLVSKNFANNDMEQTENTIVTAFYFGLVACSFMSMAIFSNPTRFLGAVLKDGSPALDLSVNYMRIRCLSLIPQMISYLCFSAFRGMLDFKPCIKITLLAAALNMALTPMLIHGLHFGILGSAMSCLVCDSLAAFLYIKLMTDKGFLSTKKLLRLPSWHEVSPIFRGVPLQARSFAMQFTNLIVARKIQSLDDTGVAPAAFSLAMQTFFMGGVVIWALGMSTQTLYPSAVAKCSPEERETFVKSIIKRLLGRGFGVGTVISCIQALFVPFILRATPLVEVRKAALLPVLIVIASQGMQGIVSVGEGIMVGEGKFTNASIILVVASIGYMVCLQLFPTTWGINGVFVSLGVFTLLRIAGFALLLPSVINHHKASGTQPMPSEK